VSPSGVQGCQWSSGSKKSELFVTRVKLAPGAPLNPLVLDYDAILVGMGPGQLVNEKKSPPTNINVSDGSVILMPKKQPYLSFTALSRRTNILITLITPRFGLSQSTFRLNE
jgi:hypothetical protein